MNIHREFSAFIIFILNVTGYLQVCTRISLLGLVINQCTSKQIVWDSFLSGGRRRFATQVEYGGSRGKLLWILDGTKPTSRAVTFPYLLGRYLCHGGGLIWYVRLIS